MGGERKGLKVCEDTDLWVGGILIKKEKDKLKIIQLIQKPQRRGAEIFAAQLSSCLQEQGHEVLLISIFEGMGNLPFSGSWIRLNRPTQKRLFDLKGWRELAKIIREFKPDLIQANAADTLKFSVFSKLLFGWNTSIVYRNANQMGDFIRGPFHRAFNAFLLWQVSATISVSQASHQDFSREFPRIGGVKSVIPIGIEPAKIDKSSNNSHSESVGLPESFLLQVGSFVKEKDPMGMIQIFGGIASEFPGLHLVFLGKGALEKEMLSLIKELGLENRVQLIGARENIFPILTRAKALVVPSVIEGLPGVILEAMYCKVPVLAYGVGGIPEVVQNGKTGFLVKKGDVQGFKNSLIKVLSLDESKKEKLTDQAKEHVMQNYQLQDIALAFEKFYQRILTPIS